MTEKASRIVRQSPSGRRLGALGFARLSLSANAAYSDGVDKQIPFDTIDDMSDGFGELVDGGSLGTAGAFRLTSTGVYLVITVATVSAPGTAVVLAQLLGAGTLVGDGKTDTTGLSVSGSAVVTSVDGTDGDISNVLRVAGASGNIVASGTSCLIVQVG